MNNLLRFSAIVVFTLAFSVSFPNSAMARGPCIANYDTDGTVARSEEEKKVLSMMPAGFREAAELRIEQGFGDRRGWGVPFAQARYDDLLFTLDFLNNALGDEFTPALQFMVVQQFTSPVHIGKTADPLKRLIMRNPDEFEELLRRHIGASRYWHYFGVCSFHTPYTFYEVIHAFAYFASHSDKNHSDVRRAYSEKKSEIPMRNLGGHLLGRHLLGRHLLIVRRSYLPSKEGPKIRFTAPPCEGDHEARNIEFKYDIDERVWNRKEPSLPIRTWYGRGFEDPFLQSGRGPKAVSPSEFAVVQDELVQRFETIQASFGLPIKFPKNLNLECEVNR